MMSQPFPASVAAARTRDGYAPFRKQLAREVLAGLAFSVAVFTVPGVVLLIVAVIRHGGA